MTDPSPKAIFQALFPALEGHVAWLVGHGFLSGAERADLRTEAAYRLKALRDLFDRMSVGWAVLMDTRQLAPDCPTSRVMGRAATLIFRHTAHA